MDLHEIEGIGATCAVKPAEVNEDKQLVRRVPSGSEVERWIEQAKTLPRVVQH